MRLPALRNASPIVSALLVKPTQAKSIFRQYFVVSITKEKPCLVNRHRCSNPQISVMGLSQSNDSHAKASQLIQNTIEGNCVVIFSKTTCNFCSMAKRLFRDLGVNYVAVELDRIEDGSHLQQVLSSRTGITTVRGHGLLSIVICVCKCTCS